MVTPSYVGECNLVDLSILIPNYNNGVSIDGKLIIERYMESIFDTTINDDVELIVIDDHSTDDSYYYLKQLAVDGKIDSFSRNKKNVHVAITTNRLVERAKSDILVRFDCDTTIISDGWVSNILDAFDKMDDNVGIIGGLQVNNKETKLVYQYGTNIFHPKGFHLVRNGDLVTNVTTPSECDAVIGCCIAFKRVMFNDINGFDESFGARMQTIDFNLRAALNGWKRVSIPGIKYHHWNDIVTKSEDKVNRLDELKNGYQHFIKKWGINYRFPDPDVVLNMFDGKLATSWRILEDKEQYMSSRVSEQSKYCKSNTILLNILKSTQNVLDIWNRCPDLTNLLRQRGAMVTEYHDKNVYSLPFDDNQFDTSICTNVLQYLAYPYKLLKELDRVTMNSGEIHIIVPYSATTPKDPLAISTFNVSELRNITRWLKNRESRIYGDINSPYAIHAIMSQRKDNNDLDGVPLEVLI